MPLYSFSLSKFLSHGIGLTFNLLLRESVCSTVSITIFIQSHQIVAAHLNNHLILLY